jgi:hypothetical protein
MERVRRQGKGWHHAFVPAPFKTLGQFNVFPKNKLQPKKKNTKSSALNTEKFSTLARSSGNDCRWGVICSNFSWYFVLYRLRLAAKKLRKETSYRQYQFGLSHKKTNKMIKTRKTTLERNSQKLLTRSNFIDNLFIHMLQWLRALNVFTGEEVIVTCLHYLNL